MPMIIISTAVPFPLRVIVENIKVKLPKKRTGIINCKDISKGLIGYSNKIAMYEKTIRIAKITT